MQFETLVSPFRKVRLVNETSSTFRTLIPTATAPEGDAGTATGASVLEVGPEEGLITQRGIGIVPFGTGNEGTYFKMRLVMWRPADAPDGNPASRLWVPLVVVEWQCILGSVVGVAGKVVAATERFCDSKTLDTSTIAYLGTGTGASGKVEVLFSTESSATDCNALYCLM